MEPDIDINIDIKSYLTFKLGGEVYACHVSKLLYILEISSISEIPDSPPYVKGILSKKNMVLPIIDIKQKMGLPPIEIGKETCIVVLNIDSLTIGILVDSALKVLEFEESDILPIANIGGNHHSGFIVGFVTDGDKFIMVLDIRFSNAETEFFKSTVLKHIETSSAVPN
ncbi:MAG: hypothetical protein B6I20_05150 [Bacteroidetes bacterium 4572_117]|nr:MAG: hypothetical protein B6I20_05150 [Bacteroidetes bacterium 4572_117]